MIQYKRILREYKDRENNILVELNEIQEQTTQNGLLEITEYEITINGKVRVNELEKLVIEETFKDIVNEYMGGE